MFEQGNVRFIISSHPLLPQEAASLCQIYSWDNSSTYAVLFCHNHETIVHDGSMLRWTFAIYVEIVGACTSQDVWISFDLLTYPWTAGVLGTFWRLPLLPGRSKGNAARTRAAT